MTNFFKNIIELIKKMIAAKQPVPVEPTTPVTISEPEPAIVTTPEPEPASEINVNDMKKKVIICLDNGHGIDTAGKGSPWSLCKVKPELQFREYLYARETVSALAQVLRDEGYEVYIVVPEDKDVALSVRGDRINNMVTNAKAKGYKILSISIHNDASGMGNEWKTASGWSVWTTPGQNNSDKLAQCLYDSAVEVLTPLNMGTRKERKDGDDDFESNLAMCRRPNCPAVLTENFFQDCVKDVEFILSDAGRKAVVEIHRRGINKFVEMMGW